MANENISVASRSKLQINESIQRTQESVENLKTSIGRHQRRKRPDQAIYRPGQLSNRTKQIFDNSKHTSHAEQHAICSRATSQSDDSQCERKVVTSDSGVSKVLPVCKHGVLGDVNDIACESNAESCQSGARKAICARNSRVGGDDVGVYVHNVSNKSSVSGGLSCEASCKSGSKYKQSASCDIAIDEPTTATLNARHDADKMELGVVSSRGSHDWELRTNIVGALPLGDGHCRPVATRECMKDSVFLEKVHAINYGATDDVSSVLGVGVSSAIERDELVHHVSGSSAIISAHCDTLCIHDSSVDENQHEHVSIEPYCGNSGFVNSSETSHRRTKRPNMQIYIPRGRPSVDDHPVGNSCDTTLNCENLCDLVSDCILDTCQSVQNHRVILPFVTYHGAAIESRDLQNSGLPLLATLHYPPVSTNSSPTVTSACMELSIDKSTAAQQTILQGQALKQKLDSVEHTENHAGNALDCGDLSRCSFQSQQIPSRCCHIDEFCHEFKVGRGRASRPKNVRNDDSDVMKQSQRMHVLANVTDSRGRQIAQTGSNCEDDSPDEKPIQQCYVLSSSDCNQVQTPPGNIHYDAEKCPSLLASNKQPVFFASAMSEPSQDFTDCVIEKSSICTNEDKTWHKITELDWNAQTDKANRPFRQSSSSKSIHFGDKFNSTGRSNDKSSKEMLRSSPVIEKFQDVLHEPSSVDHIEKPENMFHEPKSSAEHVELRVGQHKENLHIMVQRSEDKRQVMLVDDMSVDDSLDIFHRQAVEPDDDVDDIEMPQCQVSRSINVCPSTTNEEATNVFNNCVLLQRKQQIHPGIEHKDSYAFGCKDQSGSSSYHFSSVSSKNNCHRVGHFKGFDNENKDNFQRIFPYGNQTFSTADCQRNHTKRDQHQIEHCDDSNDNLLLLKDAFSSSMPHPTSHQGGIIRVPHPMQLYGSKSSNKHSQCQYNHGYVSNQPTDDSNTDLHRLNRRSCANKSSSLFGNGGTSVVCIESKLSDPKDVSQPDGQPLHFEDIDDKPDDECVQNIVVSPPFSSSHCDIPAFSNSRTDYDRPSVQHAARQQLLHSHPPIYPPVASFPVYRYHMPQVSPIALHRPAYYGCKTDASQLASNNHDRDYDQTMSTDPCSQRRVLAEHVLRDASPLDCQLTNILYRGLEIDDDGNRKVKQLRLELQRRYEHVLLLDIEVGSQRGVDQLLWRSVYYNIIEGLRRRQSAASQEDSWTKRALLEILDEGTVFYEVLLEKLSSTYTFNLDMDMAANTARSSSNCHLMRLSILSAQRSMMFLGDIARYREQANNSSVYGVARHWYIRAQKLVPRNGRPFNQLAILAIYTRRKLDAVYYYQRSLAARNPILTARQSLMALFDDVCRKEKAAAQKRLQERLQEERQRRRSAPHPSVPRVELWISADGLTACDKNADHDDSEDDGFNHLSPSECNKRFVMAFLNAHGRLFTKINFEGFVENADAMLGYWRVLLDTSPALLSSEQLIMIMAINMFSIDNTVLKDENLESSCRSLLQDHAVEMSLDMFGLLAARTDALLMLHMTAASGTSSPQTCVTMDVGLRMLLPGLSIWVDWMMCHSSLWNPQPSLRPPDVVWQMDVWESVAGLCNSLKCLGGGDCFALTRDRKDGYEAVCLAEDSMLAGFVPLLSAPVDAQYVAVDADKEAVGDQIRLQKVMLFGEYLCGIEPPMLAFNVETGCYYSVAPAPTTTEESSGAPVMEDLSSEDEDVIVESEEFYEDDDGSPGSTIKSLKARKAELHQQVERQARGKHSLQTILNRSKLAPLQLEVRPRMLVADTNCYIDHLHLLRAMLGHNSYTLVVPLVVLNELDGLAKRSGHPDGHHRDKNISHVATVAHHAKQAVSFIETEFGDQNKQLQVQTSKGSILKTLTFRSEHSDCPGNNDDVILSCCLHHCSDEDYLSNGDNGSRVHILRHVVLLTDDRNLRLKAHASNVPVKDVRSFCRWGEIT